jgi:hypothetical protein
MIRHTLLPNGGAGGFAATCGATKVSIGSFNGSPKCFASVSKNVSIASNFRASSPLM